MAIMNFARIRYFLALCETLHFTNTAKALGISQPALTKSIRQLETELGTRLVRREGKHTHLTPQGVIVRSKYQALMRLVDRAEQDINQSLTRNVQQLRIGIHGAIWFKPFATFLCHFHHSHPNVHIHLADCDREYCVEMLLNGHLDCVVSPQIEPLHDRVEVTPLYEDVVYTASYHSCDSSVDCRDAVSERLDRVNNGHSHELDRIIVSLENCGAINIQSAQSAWVETLVEAGLGVGFSSRSPKEGVTSTRTDERVSNTRAIVAMTTFGRRDSEAMIRFIYELRNYSW